MRFTEFESNAKNVIYDMTKQRDVSRLNVSLDDLWNWDINLEFKRLKYRLDYNKITTSGELISNFNRLKQKSINNEDKDVKLSFEDERNSFSAWLPLKDFERIDYVLDNSISQVPGLKRNVFEYLKSKGIKTIYDYQVALTNNTFNNNDLANLGLKKADIEDVQIKLERASNPSLIRVYHSSADINVAKYILNHEWGNGPNSQAYGTGLYTCWTLSSAFHDIDVFGRNLLTKKNDYAKWAIEKGKAAAIDNETYLPVCFRFEFVVDVRDYYIYNWEVFHQTHLNECNLNNLNSHNFLQFQDKKFGVRYSNGGAQKNFWGFNYTNTYKNPHYTKVKAKDRPENDDSPLIRGVIFNGANDGDVVVVYDTLHAVPTRYSKGDEEEWFSIGGLDYISQAERVAGFTISGSALDSFWKNIASSLQKCVRDIISSYNGSDDMNVDEYIKSNGRDFEVYNSLELGSISTPRIIDFAANKDFNKFTLSNCLLAKEYNINFARVNDFIIDNKVPANVEQITSIGKNLFIGDQMVVKHCPNAILPWSVIESDNNNGKLKIWDVGVNTDTIFKGFAQAYFIKTYLKAVKTGQSQIYTVNHDFNYDSDDDLWNDKPNNFKVTVDNYQCVSLIDCNHIHLRQVNSESLNIILDTKSSIDKVIIEDCNIHRLNFISNTENTSINLIDLKGQTNIDEFYFKTQTSKNNLGVYTDDNNIDEIVYNFETFTDICYNHPEYLKDDTDINIKNVKID